MRLKEYLNEFRQGIENKRVFKSEENLIDNILHIETTGQVPERSFEDRDVFTEIGLESTKENASVTHGGVDNKITTGLTGEDAIKLGQQFIESGNQALEYNRKNAYEVIQLIGARAGINKGEYNRLIITKKPSENRPPNHGDGFYYYDLLYVSSSDINSRLIEDVVIFGSPFEDEFNKQLNNYSCGLPVDKIGGSYEQVKADFEKFKKQINSEQQ